MENWHDLVTDNLDLARSLAYRFRRKFRTTIPQDELEAQANLELVQAAKTYRPDRGTAFKSWAFRCINNGLRDLSMVHQHHHKWNRYVAAMPYDPPCSHPHHFEDVEEMDRLVEMAELSMTEREAIQLRLEMDMDYEEMMSRYGGTYYHWHGAYRRAIQKIRDVWGAYYV